MSSSSFHSTLLGRTKLAQCRTAYYTLRNTFLGINQKPVYIVEPFKLIKNARQQLAIRKAYAARRNSRKGPFLKLLQPHSYTQVFGDPAYYSYDELVNACEKALVMSITDRTFWWHICEKIRKVRDVLNIRSLLLCLSCVIKANYLDQNLMRVLSLEFVDDINKLTVVEIAQLMQCYVRANVYSVDLIDASGTYIAEKLMTQVESTINPSATSAAESTGGSPINDQETQYSVKHNPESLGVLASCFSYYGYQNRDLYLSIAYLAIKSWEHLDLNSRCTILANLDPKTFQPCDKGDAASVSKETAMHITSETVSRMTTLLCDLEGKYPSVEIKDIANDIEVGYILSNRPAGSMESYMRALKSLSSASIVSKNLGNAICRLVDNANYIKREKKSYIDFEKAVTALMSQMEQCISNIMALAQEFSRECKALNRNANIQPDREQDSIGSSSSLSSHPSVNAIMHLFMESLLIAIMAINASLRLRADYVVHYDSVYASKLSFSVSDGTIHSRLYNLSLKPSNSEDAILQQFMEAVDIYGLQCHDPELITTAFETISLISRKETGNINPSKRAQATLDQLSLQIVKDLVSYRDESRYRIMLGLKNSGWDSNAYLEHALETFTKYMRMSRCSTAFVCDSPYALHLRAPFLKWKHTNKALCTEASL